jgi:hypothetical protein
MPNVDYRRAVEVHGSKRAAARALNIDPSTLRYHLRKYPELPDSTEPIVDLRKRLRDNFNRRQTRRHAELWMPLQIPESQAFAFVWFGDPHLGDDDCNMPLLEQHAEICRQPGIYGACVGDYSNNWVGSLMRKYADQETGSKSERELIKWFAKDCGVDWRLWLFGNHDMWREGEAILGLIVDQAFYVAAWEARVTVKTLRAEWKVHAAHSFPGRSMWNSNHGGLRTARMNSPAELFVEGHTHNFGIQEFEKPGDGRVAHVVQTRGYKWHDEYAVVKGFEQVQSGASVMTIFDPDARTAAGRITKFADVELGADFLKFLRKARFAPVAKAKPKKGKRK